LPIAQERRLFYRQPKEGGVDGVFFNPKKGGIILAGYTGIPEFLRPNILSLSTGYDR